MIGSRPISQPEMPAGKNGEIVRSLKAANGTNGAYYTLMATINDALLAFYNDLSNQGLLGDALLVSFSEFGRRITATRLGTDPRAHCP